MKKILTLITFALLGLSNTQAQDCDLPALYSGNTGANMTIMLTPDLINSLSATDANAYLVALSSDGIVIGSGTVGGVSQTTIAVWGDDASTADVVDGALAGESISFQLVNGSDLYDVELPSSVSYTTNDLAVQATPAVVTLVDCSTGSVDACPLPSSDVLNTGANMTVMLLPDAVSSLNTTAPDAYLVALTADGLIVGSVVVGGVSQTTIAVWGDDSSTTEIDGALADETVYFQLVDGADLYNVELPSALSYTTNGMSVQQTAATVTVVDCSVSEDVLGCMDATANNYNVDATIDDSSCTYDSSGTAIEYQLSSGWNMVGYTGTTEITDIVTAMDAALGNGAGTANTFSIIKNVTGAFWTADIALLEDFVPGEGYMMYVNGATTSITFSSTVEDISYDLSSGWNMVAFTGDVDAGNLIVSAMDAALENGAGTANTFSIIKNVTGAFWTEDIALLTSFVPGEAYMMYVNGSPTTVNFQQ